MTIAGWHLFIEWKYRSTYYVALKDIKQSYPVELADYAKRIKNDDESMFAWWVLYVQENIEIKLFKVKSRSWKQTQKYGIRLPKSVK